jgi:hypothetical protein
VLFRISIQIQLLLNNSRLLPLTLKLLKLYSNRIRKMKPSYQKAPNLKINQLLSLLKNNHLKHLSP